eukprot:g4327.t1
MSGETRNKQDAKSSGGRSAFGSTGSTLRKFFASWSGPARQRTQTIKEHEKMFRIPDSKTVELVKDFENQLETGLQKDNESSLKMMPSWITSLPTGHETGEFYAIDVGGTNLRILYCQFGASENKVEVQERNEIDIPETRKHGTIQNLFDFIVASFRIFLDMTGRVSESQTMDIGFCFSFPLKMEGITVGIIAQLTKSCGDNGVVLEASHRDSFVLRRRIDCYIELNEIVVVVVIFKMEQTTTTPNVSLISPITEIRQVLSEREKLQLKQRGDNLRRRQGIGSLKYAEFFFTYRQAYPFTRKTFPILGGRVETGNEAWDGVDPMTGQKADWLKNEESKALRIKSDRRRELENRKIRRLRSSMRSKRIRCSDFEYDSSPKRAEGGGDGGGGDSLSEDDGEATDDSMEEAAGVVQSPAETQGSLDRDLKLLMDALTQIPTPRRAAVALESMLAKPEVQYALEKFGTGAELGLTRKELAAIAVLQSAVECRKDS